ncbi:MAG: glutamine synthetase family protein [Oscillospiraceae bacterium]|nr:glutamine synthetase family protein [Oscillospiraceae bacterium]
MNKYTAQEVIQYVEQEDVKFIRLAFCDVFGRQKNLAILPSELERAFSFGIPFDASAIPGFGGEVRSDLILHPDPATLSSLPWHPENGRVVRMFCSITHPDGTAFEGDCRAMLRRAVLDAEKAGLSFAFGAEMEFYLFKTDENGAPTKQPYDHAHYMDIAPEDKCEIVRREICLTLSQMGIQPECAHHEEGPGQNEIDFRYSDPLSAADNAITFRSVVKTIVARNGLSADFSPKPLADEAGNGMHINFSVRAADGTDHLPATIAGIMDKVRELTLFLNPVEESYRRLGSNKAPGYITWSSENRSQLIRIPAAPQEQYRAELRSPDPYANPYLAYALLIYAGLHGIENKLTLPESADVNLYTTDDETLRRYQHIPATLHESIAAARGSAFLRAHLPELILTAYTQR